MKKFLALMLSLVLVLSLFGCGSFIKKDKTADSEVSEPEEVTVEEPEEEEEAPVTVEPEEPEVIEEPEEPEGPTEIDPFTGWTTSRVNFRKTAEKADNVITVVNRNTELTVKGEQNGFYYVTIDGQDGFISKDLISNEEPKDNGIIVCIDPGHQTSGSSKTEPNGPGSSTMKARVTGGAVGTTTGLTEYKLNLEVGVRLKEELENRGYIVYMTRETNDVNISNMERAQYATNVGADITVRIHANSSDSSSTNGALMLVPSSSNPYVSNLAADSQRLGQCILDSYCSATGIKKLSVQGNDTMTGINWCTMPVTIIEMGFMSNPSDDTYMADSGNQSVMARGIADGIDAYYGR